MTWNPDVLPEAVSAAMEALDCPLLRGIDLTGWERTIATVALEAAEPPIRAAERDRIVRAIRVMTQNPVWGADFDGSYVIERVADMIAASTGDNPDTVPLTRRHIAAVLTAMGAEVAEVNRANGWHDADRTFGDDIALLHTEVSEAFEAFRVTGTPEDQTAGSAITPGGNPGAKPEGVGSELADVLIRLLDTCHRYGIDLGAEYARKIGYNRGRGYRHGGKHL